ncbi:ACT domain-containing protein [Tenacibaculum sp. SG-28]|uniref:ACT domain-containing protein n=1 Tax=Tenacibaculum sp. SG-28 TaxID=754426 RepID=UPI000CF43C5B|nr:ACT domain-containing protein [Tenacibaculum sp. SG-28]PQJ22768.1 acetyltransferase [Tenacibaculum sp. SG-28]
MSGECNLEILLKNMTPRLNEGAYVFVSLKDTALIPREETVFEFKEAEGVTVVLSKIKADELHLHYDFVAAWITLMVHSSLHAVGLTAAFSSVLAEQGISCNVVAGFYHDHLFVPECDTKIAISVLNALSQK